MKPFSAALAALALVVFGFAAARAQSTPRPKTGDALMCLLAQAPVGCDEALRDTLRSCYTNLDPGTCYPFIRTRIAFVNTQRCNSPHGSLGLECPLGTLQSVEYLGAQKSGYDVYDVKYRNNEDTYLLSAEANGEIHFHRFGGPPARVMPPAMVAITAPAMQLLFSPPG